MNALAPLLLSLAVLGAEPDAEVTARAKELGKTGEKLFRAGKFREAADQFQQALALRPKAALHFNLARCLDSLDDVPGALREYKEYLRLAPTASDRGAVEETLGSLDARLGTVGLRQLQVLVEPPSATVSIDGRALGSSPVYAELSAGTHEVVARAEGHEAVTRKVSLEAPKSASLTLQLPALASPVAVTPPVPVESPPAPASPPPVVAVGPESSAPAEAVSGTSAVEAPAPRHRLFTWMALGTSAAALGAGIGLGLAANGASSRLLVTTHTRAEADVLVGQTRGFATGANVSWGIAAGALVAAVVLFFVEGASP